MYKLLDKLLTVIAFLPYVAGMVYEFAATAFVVGRDAYHDQAYRILAMAQARDD
jgi:hypothetical protein